MSELKLLNVSELNPPLRPTLVRDMAGLEAVRDFFRRVKVFGWDVETDKQPTVFERRCRTIQLGNRDEQYVIDLLAFAGPPKALYEGQGNKICSSWAAPVMDVLREGLESGDHLKVGVNLQFDYETMYWCFGVRPWNFYDCELAEKVIYCGLVNFFIEGFWAMDDMVARYCRLKIDKSYQTSFDLHSPLTEEQIAYCALDTRLPLAIKAGQKATIEKAGLQRTVDLENAAIGAFGDMHVNGILLDAGAWMKVVEATKEKHAEHVKVLDTHFIPVVGEAVEPTDDLAALEAAWRNEKDKVLLRKRRAEYMEARKRLKEWRDNAESFEGEAAINYGSNQQLLKALRKMGFSAKELPNTNDKTLSRLSNYPVIKALQDYRDTKKRLTTYGEDFVAKNVNPITGRVHSKINQLGAETGRTSSVKPNIQNIPRGSEYRSCFVARPGFKIITVDMSGAELRIIAEISKDPTWIEAFKNDWDVHSIGAQDMDPEQWAAGIEEGCAFATTKKKCKCKGHNERRNANKTINFGVAYGMEEGALADKLKISRMKAREKLVRWREVNAIVYTSLEQLGKSALMTLEARTMSGRRRRFVRPTWELAAERARRDAAKQKRDPRLVGTQEINRKYHAMYSSIEREGKNTPIQGTNADIAKIAMGAGFDKNGEPFMWHRLWAEFGAELVNFVHDEFVVECPEENAEACMAWIGDCIRRAGTEFFKHIAMEYEGQIADRWKK